VWLTITTLFPLNFTHLILVKQGTIFKRTDASVAHDLLSSELSETLTSAFASATTAGHASVGRLLAWIFTHPYLLMMFGIVVFTIAKVLSKALPVAPGIGGRLVCLVL